MKHFKRMLWIIPLGFVVLGLIGQLLISTGAIPEKAGENPKPTPTITKTITPKPSIKPKEDPWTQWGQFNVAWNEYSLEFEKELWTRFDAKDCQGMQYIFDLLAADNGNHIIEYGHTNSGMMRFVDYLLKAQNCYK